MLLLLSLTGRAFADGKVENRRFMRELALFVQDRLDHEQEVRGGIRAFIGKNRDKVKEGFGKHPELMPELSRTAGVEKLNCVSGRYFEELQQRLNNEERHLFQDCAHQLPHWALMAAVEEADKMGVKKTSPPLSYRMRGDIPYYIAMDLRAALEPYLAQGADKEEGFSFDGLACE